MELLVVLQFLLGSPFFLLSAYCGDILPWQSIRRRLFIMTGAAIVFISLPLFTLVHSFLMLTFFSIFIFIGICSSDSAHAALIVDNFHGARRVIAGKWFSACTFLGMLLGPLLAGILTNTTLLEYIDRTMQTDFFVSHALYVAFCTMVSIVLICAILNVINIREVHLKKKSKKNLSLLHALKSTDIKTQNFYWLLTLRCLVFMVTISFPGFLLYFSKDMLLSVHPEFLVASAMFFSTIFSFIGLKLASAQWFYQGNEIKQIRASIILIGASVILMALSVYGLALFFLAMIIFGLAYGCLFSVSLEFSLKLIPNEQLKGFFMSFSTSTTFIASILGMFFSGSLLYYFGKISNSYGYLSIGIFFISLLLASLFVLKRLSIRVRAVL